MNFTQLEYFLTIAQVGSFSNASEHAHISQSSLSKQIKALENEIGAEVFVRDLSGVTLTPAGEVLFEFATNLFGKYKDVLEEISQYNQSAHKHVRIGALPLLSNYGLSSTLADFQAAHFDLQVDLYEREQANLLRRLELGQIDMAVIRTDFLDPGEYEWVSLAIDDFVIVCPVDHSLAGAESIPLSKLKNEQFVVLGEGSELYKLFQEAARKSGLIPNVTFSHSRHEPLLACVKKGIGISVLPRGLSQLAFPPNSLAYATLQEPIYSEIGLVYPRNKPLSQPAQLLYDFFCETLEKQGVFRNGRESTVKSPSHQVTDKKMKD